MKKIDALLDLAEAIEFREENPPVLDHNGMMPDVNLSKYTRATPDALEFLAKQGYNAFVFIGLEKLDRKNAMALASWDAFLCFSNIDYLNTEIATILVDGGNALDLGNLREIGVDVARELAKSNNLLGLSLNDISIEVASELARHPHELFLYLNIPPSDQVLHVLCNHAGYKLWVTWERPPGSQPREFLSSNQSKRVFLRPTLIEETGQWFENVCIYDADFYSSSPTSEDEIIGLP